MQKYMKLVSSYEQAKLIISSHNRMAEIIVCDNKLSFASTKQPAPKINTSSVLRMINH